MLRGVATPVLAPGVLVYKEIWNRHTQPLEDVLRALSWELHHVEWWQPLGVQADSSEGGFVVYVTDANIYARLLAYSDVVFIGDGCFVLTSRGPSPPQ